jgi:hypothetical protein
MILEWREGDGCLFVEVRKPERVNLCAFEDGTWGIYPLLGDVPVASGKAAGLVEAQAAVVSAYEARIIRGDG